MPAGWAKSTTASNAERSAKDKIYAELGEDHSRASSQAGYQNPKSSFAT
jgi:hypothetical protein